MYSQRNLIVIKPKYYITNFIKQNSFFNKIIVFNNNIKFNKVYK
jgi:hypothetical protein